jgi:CotH kinase protein/Secretion system C-terminal sorting domain
LDEKNNEICSVKKNTFYCCLLLILQCIGLPAQENYLFGQDNVPSIRVSIAPDSFMVMLDSLVNKRYMPLDWVVFDDGTHVDTIFQAAMRLRGNTSLFAQKKSFKISFNEIDSTLDYQGVRKLNLLGSHNDPTMVRQKLFYDVWEMSKMPSRRGNFVRFYVNGEFRGTYTNLEEIDKRWLKRVFPENDGNLYKCTYPADLDYLGDNQAQYKTILNNPSSRAYDLVTNEESDDYGRLVQLIKTLNQPVNAIYKQNIDEILNVVSVLKAFAIDVATGHWDDYFYNKNNYYLYDNPATGKFEFIAYDTDNSFGVDWLGKDWATRNCLSWQKSNEARPLASKLLQVPEFKGIYVRFLDSLTRFITRPDSIFPRIDEYRDLLSPYVYADYYRTLDYGYTIGSFYGGFTEVVDDHTPYGIKPFLTKRFSQTMSQLAGVVKTVEITADKAYEVFPNPAVESICVSPINDDGSTDVWIKIRDLSGKIRFSEHFDPQMGPIKVGLNDLEKGVYLLNLMDGDQKQIFKICKF